jgi:hypothetical protein
MSVNNSLVATYANHSLAEATIRKLQNAGFNMKKLSIISNDPQDIAGKFDGAAVVSGLEALDEMQYGCIPKESVLDYEAELTVDRTLLVAHGTSDEISLAKSIVDLTHPEDWGGGVGCTVYYGCLD